MYLKRKIYLLTIVLLFIGLSKHSYSIEPNIFVQSTVNRASTILSNDITKEEKIEKLKKVALETVDIKGIGFYTLGKHRKTLSDQQKKRILSTFQQIFSKEFFK